MMLESTTKSKTSPQQIYFEPRNKNEKKYLEKLTTLLEQKRYGDWETVAGMLSIETKNTEMAFRRVHSKYHNDVVTALEKVIQTRQNLINN